MFSGSLFRLRYPDSTHCACDRNKLVFRLLLHRCRQHLMSTKAGVINSCVFPPFGARVELVPRPPDCLGFLISHTHTHTHTQTHTYTRTHTHSHSHIHGHTDTNTDTHGHTDTHEHTDTHTQSLTNTRTRGHGHGHTHGHTDTDTQSLTHTHTDTDTHEHTDTVGLLRTSGQLVTEAATYTTHNEHKTNIHVLSGIRTSDSSNQAAVDPPH